MLAVAQRAAVSAGEYSVKNFGKPRSVRRKGAIDLVTEVDKKSEDIIRKAIHTRYPSHGFFGEETGNDGNTEGYQWIVDPVDGTTNFVHGYPCYGVSLGLRFRGAIVLGCIYEPLTKNLYCAHTYMHSEKNGRSIHVSPVKKLINALMITGFYYTARDRGVHDNMPEFKRMVKATQGVRRDGAAVIDFCRVAEGVCEGFWELGLAPWDICAGAIIVVQAGGTVSGLDGKPYVLESRGYVAASNGYLHKPFIKTLRGK